MGGQVAEEQVFGDITTGAHNDLQNANRIARRMVTEYGMSDALGPRTFGTGQEMVFLGKELAQGTGYSDAVAEKIDGEISRLLDKARSTAGGILQSNAARLRVLAQALLKEETIEGPKLRELLSSPGDEAAAPA